MVAYATLGKFDLSIMQLPQLPLDKFLALYQSLDPLPGNRSRLAPENCNLARGKLCKVFPVAFEYCTPKTMIG